MATKDAAPAQLPAYGELVTDEHGRQALYIGAEPAGFDVDGQEVSAHRVILLPEPTTVVGAIVPRG